MAGGLPHVPVHDVQVHPREGDLVVATHGRSVYVAEAAPLRKLTAEVRAKALHAFPIKTVKSGANRGYGDHPWITWPREDVVVRIAYWSKDGAPATVAIKDEHGSLWRELPGTSLPGMNVVEYDLSADPKLADAAEATALAKARQKQAAAKSGDKARPPPLPTRRRRRGRRGRRAARADLVELGQGDARPGAGADPGRPAAQHAAAVPAARPLHGRDPVRRRHGDVAARPSRRRRTTPRRAAGPRVPEP